MRGILMFEDGEVGRIGPQAIERGSAVIIGLDAITFAFKGNGYGSQDIAIVVDEAMVGIRCFTSIGGRGTSRSPQCTSGPDDATPHPPFLG